MAASDTNAGPYASAPTQRRTLREKLLRSLDVWIPASLLLLIVLACFVWPAVYDLPPPIGGFVVESGRPLFSPGHWLGTDLSGNDVLSRLLHGGRASLQVAAAVNLLGLLVGGFVGALGAYLDGIADSVTTRILDVLIAFPSIVLVLAIVQGLGPSQTNTIWALAFFSVPAFARVARAATLRLREEPFIMAARLSGSTALRVLSGHVAPNVLPQLLTFGLLGMGIAVIVEGALSFLGLGVPMPMPSWGNMIAHGQQAMLTKPALVLLPSLFLFVTVVSFNLLGDALRARWAKGQ